MMRPTPSRLIRFQSVQRPASIRLEIVHNFFRLSVGFNNHVNVIGPHMRSEKDPTAMPADLSYCVKDNRPSMLVEEIRRLRHCFAL